MKRYSAKNLDELLNNAAQEKGVSTEDLTYYIVEEKQGFLGFGTEVIAEVYAQQDVLDFLKEYVEKFLHHYDSEATVSVTKDRELILVSIDASNNAILIGKNGQTLQAVNTVVKGAVNSKFKHRFQLVVDINDYKKERYEKVRQMAKRIAKNVEKTKIAAILDPMPNDERKVVHQALSKMRNIKTESEGDGRNRRLRIFFDQNAD
jgi:spoIIIJ-associated protein